MSAEVSADAIKLFETKRYSAVAQGARSIFVDVEMPEMIDYLKKTTTFSNLDRVATTVKWQSGKEPQISVEGLGDRFLELQQLLIQLVSTRTDYIIPKPLKDFTDGYKLTSVKAKDSEIIKGIDHTGKKQINQFELKFDREGILSELKVVNPGSTLITRFTYSTMPWSNNKFVLTNVKTIDERSMFKTEMDSDIKYKVVEGYGLPEVVMIETRNYSTGKSEVEPENSTIKFSNYRVNQE